MEINKLIDALRVCADENIICPACERYISMKETGGTADCVDDLLVKAASALEAQQKRIAELEAGRRWIPMGERHPEEGQEVQIYVGKCLNPYVTTMRWWPHLELSPYITKWKPLSEPPEEDKQ